VKAGEDGRLVNLLEVFAGKNVIVLDMVKGKIIYPSVLRSFHLHYNFSKNFFKTV
jgi:hypothetical protein